MSHHRDTRRRRGYGGASRGHKRLKLLLLLPLCGGAVGSLVLICHRLPANQKNKTLCELCVSSEAGGKTSEAR
jgi:hypothetical protein